MGFDQVANFVSWGEKDRSVNVYILLAVGTFFLWIPYARYLGFLLDAVGITLLLIRKRPYVEVQRKYVIGSSISYAASLALVAVILLFQFLLMPAYLAQNIPLSAKEAGFDRLILEYLVISIIPALTISISFSSATWNIIGNRDRSVAIVAMALLLIVPLLNVFDLTPAMLTDYNIAINFSKYGSLMSDVLSYAGRYALYAAVPCLMYVYVFARAARNVADISSQDESKLMEKFQGS